MFLPHAPNKLIDCKLVNTKIQLQTASEKINLIHRLSYWLHWLLKVCSLKLWRSWSRDGHWFTHFWRCVTVSASHIFALLNYQSFQAFIQLLSRAVTNQVTARQAFVIDLNARLHFLQQTTTSPRAIQPLTINPLCELLANHVRTCNLATCASP